MTKLSLVHGAVVISDSDQDDTTAMALAASNLRIARRCVSDSSATVAELRWALRRCADSLDATLGIAEDCRGD